ncbi:MAG: DUF1343 domain-containing protein [Saonia sp.]
MAFLSGLKNTVLLWVLLFSSCGNQIKTPTRAEAIVAVKKDSIKTIPLVVGANSTEIYLPLLKEKRVGIVANQTSVIFKTPEQGTQNPKPHIHLVDSLLALDIDLKKVFAPEHGFRGEADAGEKVVDGIDITTGIPLISLYGKHKKPSPEQLEGLDIVVFDIQDVGVRFYTYIATLQLVMEACAAQQIPVVVLDRPNPNGHYVDGPSMEKAHVGFLGMNTIPLVYGMTIGEYAQMINEEGWLEGNAKADLTVVPLKNYTHNTSYGLPIRPSPNLPNDVSINLYPSLGFFEGTSINAGRGTEFQFQRYGAPFLDSTQYHFTYTPKPNFGAKYPKHEDKLCYGNDLSTVSEQNGVSLKWLIDAYSNTRDKTLFFNSASFTKHAGTEKLQRQIEAGLPEEAIKKSWQEDLEAFKKVREKYLIYD